MEILFFGQLVDVTGTSVLRLGGFKDLDALEQELHVKFPDLKDKKYRIAVGNKITTGNLELADADMIAFLPPFSGG